MYSTVQKPWATTHFFIFVSKEPEFFKRYWATVENHFDGSSGFLKVFHSFLVQYLSPHPKKVQVT